MYTRTAIFVATLVTSWLCPSARGGEIEIKLKRLKTGAHSASARYLPWSGDWWNMKDGELGKGYQADDPTYTYDEAKNQFVLSEKVSDEHLAPLRKYDLYIQRRFGYDPGSALHELKGEEATDFFHHVYGEQAKKYKEEQVDYSWWGHCNGWAAAAILAREPQVSIEREGLRFEVADLKGLLTESFFGVESDFTGRRYRAPDKKDEVDFQAAKKLLEGLASAAADAPLEPYVAWYEKTFEEKIADDVRAKLKLANFKKLLQDFVRRYEDTYIKAFEDLRPDAFHGILTTVIGKQRGAVVFDITAGEAVWNYPAFAYDTEVTFKEDFQDKGQPRKRYAVETTVRYANDGVDKSVLGLRWFAESYEYELVTDAKGRLVDGRWTGRSVKEHPDFAWLPLRNPYGPDPEENQKLEFRRLLSLLPAYWNTGMKKRIQIVAELAEGQNVPSGQRRGQDQIVSLHDPVATASPSLGLSLLLEGHVATWRAEYYLQGIVEEDEGAEKSFLAAPGPLRLLARVERAANATSEFRARVDLPGEGLHQVVCKLFDRRGRLIATDELAVRVGATPAAATPPAAPAEAAPAGP